MTATLLLRNLEDVSTHEDGATLLSEPAEIISEATLVDGVEVGQACARIGVLSLPNMRCVFKNILL
jgi:hypothetical protein